MFFQHIHTGNFVDHVEHINFDNLFAVDGQLVIGVFQGVFMRSVIPDFCRTGIQFSEAATRLDFARYSVAGCVVLALSPTQEAVAA